MFRNFSKFASIIALWGIFAIGQSVSASDNLYYDDEGFSVDYLAMADSFFDNFEKIYDVDPVTAVDMLNTTINSASVLAVERNISRLSSATFDRVHFWNDSDVRRGLWMTRTTLGQSPARSRTNLNPWFSQFGDFLNQKDTNAVPGYKSNSYAFITGLDKKITRESMFGVGIGSSWASVSSNTSYHTPQKGKANSFMAIGYGSYNIDHWTIAADLGYASSEYLFSRNIFGIGVESQIKGDSFFGGLDISKKFRYNGIDVTPFASLNFVAMSVDDYRDSLDIIRIESQNGDSILQTMGVRFAKSILGEYGSVWTPGAYGAWVHDYKDGEVTSSSSYFGSLPLRTIGAVRPDDRGAFGLNINVAMRHLSVFGALDLEFGSKYNAETIQAGFSFEF